MNLIAFNTDLGQSVKMTELYDYLELRKADYSRFVQNELIDNPYADEKSYSAYVRSENDGKHGRFRKEYYLHIDFAKKLCMGSRSKKGNEVRDYLVNLTKQVENNDLLTHEQVIYLVKLKEVFKYISNCKEAEKMHLEKFVEQSANKNPFAEFHTFRNEVLKLDKETINNRLKQYCIEHDRIVKPKTKIEHLILFDKYEILHNGVWDFLMAKESKQAEKLAKLATEMARVEQNVMRRANEDNLFDYKQNNIDIKSLE